MNTHSLIILNNKLEKFSSIKKLLVLLIVIIILIAFFILYIFKPKQARISKLDDKVTALQKELEENRKLIKDIDELKEGLGEIENKFKKIQAQLPTKKEIPDLLTKISDLANLLGLEVLLFKPRPEIKKQFYNEVPIEIKMKGTYNNVNKFFDFISKLPRIVNIQNITMAQPKFTKKEVIINTNCMATTYRFAEQVKKKGKKNAKKRKKKK